MCINGGKVLSKKLMDGDDMYCYNLRILAGNTDVC